MPAPFTELASHTILMGAAVSDTARAGLALTRHTSDVLGSVLLTLVVLAVAARWSRRMEINYSTQ